MKKLLTLIILLTGSVLMAQKTKILDLSTHWRFTIGNLEGSELPEYDDRNWEKIKVPSAWEDQGFPNYNGFAWYRFTFDGNDLQSFKNLTLSLGYIDDVNETYFNGELIGFKGSFPPNFYTAYDAQVNYQIPEYLIRREGENTIAVKVYDVHLGGGIIRGNVGIYSEPRFPDEYFSLEGVWKFTTRERNDWQEVSYNDSRWDNIVVPSYWRSKYLKWLDDLLQINRYGWYRKEFKLPAELKNEDLYLLLGLIDDFDITYLNGEFVGSTDDNLPFGESNSWQEYRIYRIPKENLNQTGINVIAVQVEDIGIDAGIYKGPIGLVREEDLTEVYRARN